MNADLKKQLITALIGLAVGVGSTYTLVWRDVAVIMARLGHIEGDVAVIQKFIADDDPKAYIAAKDHIRTDHHNDQKDRGEKP
jgi:hypothetical protein